MVRGLHHLIAIVTALALVVSSAGWSVASVRASFSNPAHQHGVTTGEHGAHAHHGFRGDATAKACHEDGTPCGKAELPDEGATCCAMAWHVAVPPDEPIVPC